MKNTTLKNRIDEYLAYRRGLGFRMDHHEMILQSFQRFVVSRRFRGRLKNRWVEEFISAPQDVHPRYRKQLHRILTDFAQYWAAYDPRVEIPSPHEPCAGYRRKEPYIYSDEEIQSLMAAARSGQPFVGETYATIVGLMACTGLRTGEAIKLRKSDVNFNESLLRVHHSKNRLLRLVPIQQTTVDALENYARQRDERFLLPTTDYFFLNKFGDPVTRSCTNSCFDRLRKRTGISVATGRRLPRLYDLRHTFACNCLMSWLQDDQDVSRLIHTLATYLGHEEVRDTYWYLTSTPLLLEITGKEFERNATQLDGRADQ